MSTPGQPKIPCPRCGHAQAELAKTTDLHVTEIDAQTQNTSSRLIATVYHMKCPKCQKEFSEKVSAE